MRDNIPCGIKHLNAFLHHTSNDVVVSSWKEPADDSLQEMTTLSTFEYFFFSFPISFFLAYWRGHCVKTTPLV